MEHNQVISDEAKKRYAQCYENTRDIRKKGNRLQGMAVLFPFAGATTGLVITNRDEGMIAGILLGILVAFLAHAFGKLLCAQSDLMLLQTDNAINSSPFLSDEEKAVLVLNVRIKRDEEHTAK